MNRFFYVAALWLLIAGPAEAQRNLTNIPDPDPELQRRSFQVADGFEVNLFAADPMLAKPIQMNWDAAGRLWIASSEVYPQIQPGQVANDKILILEDSDGDGRADKTTVFADGLLIPTGVEPDVINRTGDGKLASSAYVANSTELLHLSDTDGDGRADTSRIVLSGFGTEDTHHIVHTFRWGHDGCLYFNQSIYIHSHIETPWGVRRLGGGGIWRLRPESLKLDILCRGFVNTWGHHFDRWGQSFATDGAFGEGINYVFPGSVFFSAPGATRILKGLNPGSPKHCGLEILSGRHLPEDWRGNMITNDFRGNRVCRFAISEDGSGYASREMPEVIKTTHVAFRPIDVKMGPDGAIYIADWYNPIIQHGEVDFRDPRRDHTHGRIWRVTAKNRPVVDRPQLVTASVAELLEHLKAPEDWTRHQAKRVLKSRGPETVVPALRTWTARLNANDPEFEHHRLEALWVFQSLDIVEPELLVSLLRTKDHRARAAATRVLDEWRDRVSDASQLVAARVVDEHPRVRLEAVRLLGTMPSREAASLAVQALDHPIDTNLDFALWLTLRDLAPHWLPAVKSNEFDFGNVRHLLFALEAVGSAEIVPILAKLVGGAKVPDDRLESVLTLIGSMGGPDDLARVFDLAVADGLPPASRVRLLNSLIESSRKRKAQPAGDLARITTLVVSPDAELRAVACRAAGLWRVQPALEWVGLWAGTDKDPRVREAAFEGLASYGAASRKVLEELAGENQPMEQRILAVQTLATVDTRAAAASTIELFKSGLSDEQTAAVFTTLFQRKAGPEAFVQAVEGQTMPADAAKIGLRVARTSSREDAALVRAITAAGNLSNAPTTLLPEAMQELVAEVAESGDAARGEAVYRRKDLNCLKCHAIAGAGGQVGPDLVSIGSSAPVDYLVDSLVDPNKAIKEGYHSTVVATTDGRVLNGIKLRETGQELVLRDGDGREIVVPTSTIEEKKTGASLMPGGLLDSLTRREMVDLVRFLSELGKAGPYAASTARVVRRWQALESSPETNEELRHSNFAAAVRGHPRFQWVPAYSTVAGFLKSDAAPIIRMRKESPPISVVRCQLNVTTPGRIKLLLNQTTGVRLWVGANMTEPREQLELDLPAGQQTLTFVLELDRLPSGLRCELADVSGSPAQVQIVTGQ